MMASLKESLAGPGYVILNALRVINIIVFLDMIAAHAVMLVKIDLLTSFFFFEAVGHAIAIVVCSECFLFQTLHSVMDMLTEISFPHSIRTSILPRVLRPSLAIPRRRFWIYYTSVCNADTWNWSIGRPQYKGYKPRRAWAHILENHHISRNPGSRCQCLECCCGKTYFPYTLIYTNWHTRTLLLQTAISVLVHVTSVSTEQLLRIRLPREHAVNDHSASALSVKTHCLRTAQQALRSAAPQRQRACRASPSKFLHHSTRRACPVQLNMHHRQSTPGIHRGSLCRILLTIRLCNIPTKSN